MLQVGIIGCGNAGNQTVAKCYEEHPEIPVVAINCSENDMQTIPDEIPKYIIGDGRGAGKNRSEAKKFLAQKIAAILSDQKINDAFGSLDIVFIISSAGGGTGSGISLLLSQVVKSTFKRCFPIPIGILPALSEAYSTQGNALEYLNELYSKMDSPTYMLYDNDNGKGMATNKMMSAVNAQIVEDINILRGMYNTRTKYMSIDEKDGLTLITTPGRIFVSSVFDIKEKEIDTKPLESLMIDSIKKNYHVGIQRDRVVNRIGVIANLSESLLGEFNSHIPKVLEIIGSPIEEFEHLTVNDDRKLPNNLFVIMAGLPRINDRIEEINDRIDEIEQAQRNDSEDSALDSNILKAVQGKRVYRDSTTPASGNVAIDVGPIFADFGVDIDSL